MHSYSPTSPSRPACEILQPGYRIGERDAPPGAGRRAEPAAAGAAPAVGAAEADDEAPED